MLFFYKEGFGIKYSTRVDMWLNKKQKQKKTKQKKNKNKQTKKKQTKQIKSMV